MGGTAGAETRLMQDIPLAAGAERAEDGSHRLSVIDAGPLVNVDGQHILSCISCGAA
jgi:hypothetical protein